MLLLGRLTFYVCLLSVFCVLPKKCLYLLTLWQAPSTLPVYRILITLVESSCGYPHFTLRHRETEEFSPGLRELCLGTNPLSLMLSLPMRVLGQCTPLLPVVSLPSVWEAGSHLCFSVLPSPL